MAAAVGVLLRACAALLEDPLTICDRPRPIPGMVGQAGEHDLHALDGNLIDNAIRHNHPGGWIHVGTGTEAGTARLVVENSGIVLDQDRVRDLTQPFRRMARDRTGTDDTGVGLELSIAAAIVATHGGTLDLHARPGGGLRVTATLPLAAQAALTPAVPG